MQKPVWCCKEKFGYQEYSQVTIDYICKYIIVEVAAVAQLPHGLARLRTDESRTVSNSDMGKWHSDQGLEILPGLSAEPSYTLTYDLDHQIS